MPIISLTPILNLPTTSFMFYSTLQSGELFFQESFQLVENRPESEQTCVGLARSLYKPSKQMNG